MNKSHQKITVLRRDPIGMKWKVQNGKYEYTAEIKPTRGVVLEMTVFAGTRASFGGLVLMARHVIGKEKRRQQIRREFGEEIAEEIFELVEQKYGIYLSQRKLRLQNKPMNSIGGYIIKLKSEANSEFFYDFIHSDLGLEIKIICLFDIKNPQQLYLIELNKYEKRIENVEALQSIVMNRVNKETGEKNLVVPKFLRIDDKNDKFALRYFRKKKYQPSGKVYQCVNDNNNEAICINKYSIQDFIALGGQIVCIGNIQIK